MGQSNPEIGNKTLFAHRALQFIFIVSALSISFAAQLHMDQGKYTDGYVLYFTSVFPLAAFVYFRGSINVSVKPMNRKWEIFIFILILATGIFLRVHRINQLPPGLWFDEAENANQAVKILEKDRFMAYTTTHFSKETGYLYFVALFFSFFGESPTSLRLVSVLFGVLMIPAVYVFLKYLFGARPALAATALCATSHWHLYFSRIGFRAIMMLPIMILALYYLFRATESGRKLHYGLSGMFLGLGFYTYIPFRFMPVLFFIYPAYAAYNYFRNRISWDRDTFRRHVAGALILCFVALAIMGPLLYFIKNHPDIYFSRAKQASLFSRFTGEKLIEAVSTNLIKYLKMFHAEGDRNARHNLPGKPALGFWIAITATPGFIIILLRFWTRRNLLYIIWFIGFFFPGVITVMAPNSLRAIGVLPLALVCCGIFLYYLFECIRGIFGRLSGIIIYPLVFVLLAANGFDTFRTYFMKYPDTKDLYESFSYGECAIAEYVKTFPENRLCFVAFASFRTSFNFLTRHVAKKVQTILLPPSDTIPLRSPVTDDVLFAMEPPYERDILPLLRQFYPWGDYSTLKTPSGKPAAYTCALTSDQVNEVFGLEVLVYDMKPVEGEPIKILKVSNFSGKDLGGELPGGRPLKLVFRGSFENPVDKEIFLRIDTPHKFDFRLGSGTLSSSDKNKPNPEFKTFIPLRKGFHHCRLEFLLDRIDPEILVEWSDDGVNYRKIPDTKLYNILVKLPDLLGESSLKTNTTFKKIREIKLDVPQGYEIETLSFAVSDSGHMYVPDPGKNQVWKFNADGKYILKWGSKGIGNGEFMKPRAVAVDNAGNVHVLDSGNNRVQVFDQDGGFVRQYGNRLWFPSSFILDSNNRCIIADTGTKTVKGFNRDGDTVLRFGSKGSENGEFLLPVALDVDGTGSIYVLDGERKDIQVFLSGRKYDRKWSVDIGTEKCSMILTQNQNILVTDLNRKNVKLYSTEGHWLYGEIFPDYTFTKPRAVMLDKHGSVYILDDVKIIVFREIPG